MLDMFFVHIVHLEFYSYILIIIGTQQLPISLFSISLQPNVVAH